MKTRTLLLALLLLVAGYVTYELGGGRNPLQYITGTLQTESATTKPAPAPAQETQTATPPGESALVLSAPPRESIEEGDKRFGPLADYLSKTLCRKVVYKHPGTLGV